ncbi:MAG: glycoside hydrolase family 2 TIM barrel-domain containing protein [Arachidicoccus sp.]|nr:glycoside hydrolase family 2 TIM barrel-domain containing protein [Arachidicoccus sp.]
MMIKKLLKFSYLLVLPFLSHAQSSYELNSNWKCIKAATIPSVSGNKISNIHYNLKDWMPATVPGTVLTTLLNNKQIPDPFYGMNNNKIPDIYNIGKAYYTYWFAKDFETKTDENNQQFWLLLRGVNYGFDIYVNGQKLNSNIEKGMFLRRKYNITSYLNSTGKNRLAIIVYPPDEVGNPNGGQGGDGTIAKNVAQQYVAGWDWIQPIRDRNTGIWDKVILQSSGSVTITNPQIVTKVPGVRDPENNNQAPAFIYYTATLKNIYSKSVSGTLQYTINNQVVKQHVTINAQSDSTIQLPLIQIEHPKLWWCNGVGDPNLYTSYSEFITDDNLVSDKDSMEVGIREIQTEWNAHTMSRQIKINGRPVFIKGGNWIVSDEMLRLSKERYDAEIHFHRDMRLNLIRVWGGALTERPEFYEACDKYGMLVMQDFWGSGDCDGRWMDLKKKDDQWTRRKYPDDHELFIASAADQIKMLRNFPSLAFWCGGNEITQPSDIQHALKDSLIPLLDGTRWFVNYSNSDSMSYNTLGDNGDGPYGIQPDSIFWQHRTFPFNSEVGSVGIGDAVSLQRFLPKDNQVIPISAQKVKMHKIPYGIITNILVTENQSKLTESQKI